MLQRDSVIKICSEFKISLPKYFWQKIDEYVNLIEGNAEKFGLVAPREVENLWRRHILDSLAIFLFYEIERGDNVLDYGSGGGFPGMVLALARPGAKFTLAESNLKKAEFLKFAAEKMGLENARIFPGRVKSVLKKFDLITIRATGPLVRTIPDAIKHIKREGKIALWIGPKFLQNISYWENFLAKRKCIVEVEPYPDRWTEARRLAMAFIGFAKRDF